MSITPLAFTGISSFSADFQTILNRAVSIASAPVQSLQNEQTKILSQKQLLTNLNDYVASLAGAVKQIGATGSSRALVASSSNTAKVTAVNANATAAATYTVSDITSVARAASASSAGYADATSTAVSATGSVRLTFNGAQYDITLDPEENNLAGLRDKINELGAGVTASVLTTGTGPTPYYLSLTATTTGLKPITLVDDPGGANTNLLASADNGADTVFKLNGVTVTKSGTLINDVVPGLSFTILGTTSGGETVTLALASDRTQLSNALQGLVSAYNALLQQVDGQIGSQAGLLTGDFIVREIQSSLRALTGYTGTGSISGLAQLGFSLSKTGEASFDQAAFDALSDTQIQAALDFFGSSTEGLGALESRFRTISDPVTGLIRIQQDKYDDADTRLASQIETETARVNALQASMSARLQAADALLAQLESQQQIINASIESLNLILFGRNDDQ